MSAPLKERLKRWTRIHVTRAQSRDLYYPVGEAGEGPALLGLLGARAATGSVFINDIQVELRFLGERDGASWYALDRDDILFPGENIVSVPVDWNVAGIHLRGGRRDDAVGWNTQPAIDVHCGHAGVDAAASFLGASLSKAPQGDELISLTAFDPAAGAPRLWSWYWTTALTYEALASLRRRGLLSMDLSGLEAGLLARQIGEGELAGSYMVRWDPDRLHESGVLPWHAPNDSAHIGLHGLLVAERDTQNPAFLEAAERLARWITGPGMSGDRLRVGFDAHRQRWDDSWLYIDAAWTPAFLVALSRRTGDRNWLIAAETMSRDILQRFETNGPYFRKIWRANGRHTQTVFARGMAWVLEGWLPMIEEGYDELRPRVSALLDALMRDQRNDGAWDYLIDQPDSGACNKGTPALAYHLLGAATVFDDRAADLRASARKALGWCEQHQIRDAESPAYGGIVAHNSEGAIVTVRDIATAFNYAAAYYVLAVERMGS